MVGAWLVTRPWPRAVDARTDLGGHAVEPVGVQARDGAALRGWLVRAGAEGAARCVVLAAGIRGNRRAMLPRAEWWLAHGWSTLLVDLRGTGESAPERVSFGWGESLDLCAWHAFLGTRGFTAIGVHGQSLGAAAAVYTAVRGEPPPPWRFVVLEACYANLREALAARLPWLPTPFTWPMVVAAEQLLDVDVDRLDPVAAITALHAPTLLVCGGADPWVGPDGNARLFAASGAVTKRSVTIAGLAHVDLWRDPQLARALGEFVAGL